jgi:hypothetical protein
MNKQDYYARIEAPQMLDYGVYLNVDQPARLSEAVG